MPVGTNIAVVPLSFIVRILLGRRSLENIGLQIGWSVQETNEGSMMRI